MNFWWRYPFSKAVRFFEATGLEPGGFVLQIGPIAFGVFWKRKRVAGGE